MSEYLSYNPDRNRPWTFHESFPKGAVKYRDRLRARYPHRVCNLRIYVFNEDRTRITLVPEEEWPTDDD